MIVLWLVLIGAVLVGAIELIGWLDDRSRAVMRQVDDEIEQEQFEEAERRWGPIYG